MPLVVPNFARTTLRASIMPASTQLPLAVGSGAYFNIGAGNYMYLTIEDGQSVEIVRYNSTGPIVNDIITVVRGQDGTTPKAFPAGSCVKVAWNVAQVTELIEDVTTEIVDDAIEAIPCNTTVIVNDDPPPTETTPPSVPCAPFYFNRETSVLRVWDAAHGKWIRVNALITAGEEYWGKSALNDAAPLVNGVLSPGGTVEIRKLGLTDQFRWYPREDPAATNLVERPQTGIPPGPVFQAVTLDRDCAMEISVSIRGRFVGPTPPVEVGTMLELVISNSQTTELFGNIYTVGNPNFMPNVVITTASGMMWWKAGAYFDGNLIYSSPTGTGPNFEIHQVNVAFHVAGSQFV